MNIRPGKVREGQKILETLWQRKRITREEHVALHDLKKNIDDAKKQIDEQLDKLDTQCDGEAHDPAVGGMIDNCTVCAPLWGTVLKEEWRKR